MKKFLVTFIALSFLIYSCTDTGGEDDITNPPATDSFNRGAMLLNLADNIIVPAYQGFALKIAALKTAGQNFTTTSDQSNLESLRTAWYDAYKTWQYVEMFNIGKAEELQLVNFMNIYPLTVADVESNVANGGYDLNSVNFHDAQGFPALDYLLYGVAADDTAILAKYTTDTNASGYKGYITDVLNQMNGLTQQVVSDWTGTYRDIFVNSTANTNTSSVNKMVNAFIFYYEKGLRANKFGIPSGVFSSNSLPEKVEAFYRKDISKDLALEALSAVEYIFEGKHYTTTSKGESFKAYLTDLERTDISSIIEDQWNLARTEINSLNNNFFQQVSTDNSKMTLAYDELQKAVVFLKVDMAQAFDVSITYQDADGD